jgi:hypothetical protein
MIEIGGKPMVEWYTSTNKLWAETEEISENKNNL